MDFLDLGRRAQLPFDQAEDEERSVEMAVPSLDLEKDFMFTSFIMLVTSSLGYLSLGEVILYLISTKYRSTFCGKSFPLRIFALPCRALNKSRMSGNRRRRPLGDLSILSHGRHGGQETPPPPGLYPSITTP